MDPTERAALAEALAGNMAVHIVYCVRVDDPPHQPDPAAETAVPVCREIAVKPWPAASGRTAPCR